MENPSYSEEPGRLIESPTTDGLPSDHTRIISSTDHIMVLKSQYTTVRVRIVTCAVMMLFSVSSAPAVSLMSQYLVYRLSEDEQAGNRSGSNVSTCYSDTNDSQTDQADELQARVSTMMMYYTYSAACPGIVFGLIIGAYADYIGRRFALLLPLLGITLKFVLFTCIIRFELDLWLFYIAVATEGVAGSAFMVYLACYTIMADINTDKKDRVLWITIISAMGNAMAAGSNIVCGIIIKNVGFFATTTFLMSNMAAAFLIALIFLPETKPHQEVRVLNLYKNVRRVFGFFLFEGTLRSKLTFTVALLMFFFAVINDLGIGAMDTLYQLHRPFCWDSMLIGYYSAIRSGGTYFVGLFLLAFTQRWVKTEYIGLLAALSQASSYILEAFIQKTWQFFLVPAVGITGCLITPVVRGILSCLAKPECQGALFTSVCIFEVACLMVSSTVFNKVYASTVSTFPGAVYICMASFSFVTFILIILYLHIHQDQKSPDYEKIINSSDDPASNYPHGNA